MGRTHHQMAGWICALVVFCLQGCGHMDTAPLPPLAHHALDPLNAEEIIQTATILRRHKKLNAHRRLALIELHEPDKAAVLSGQAGRNAYALMYDWATRHAYEAKVDLRQKKIVAWRQLRGREPPAAYLTLMRLQEIVFADPLWHAAMRKRGLSKYDAITLWPNIGPDEHLPRMGNDHVVRAYAVNNAPSGPEQRLMNLDMEVNLTTGKILQLDDTLQGYQRPKPLLQLLKKNAAHDPPSRKPRGYRRNGSEIRWHNWRLHYGMHPRRGLEIYAVSYMDGQTERSVLYRGSLSELVTSYDDARYRADAGELNLALYGLQSGREGVDAPVNAEWIPAVIYNHQGLVQPVKNAVAIYERDGGLAWRHMEEAHRTDELVLSAVFSIDHTDYVQNWIFRQDGSIEAEMVLSGMIPMRLANETLLDANTPAAPDGVNPQSAVHESMTQQRFFNFRLDLDVDGVTNSVAEMNTTASGDGDSTSPGYATRAWTMRNEKQGKRGMQIASNRWWQVFNPTVQTERALHPAYALRPLTYTLPMANAKSTMRKKNGFVDATFWVTPYDPKQMYAAGRYFTPDLQDQGLPGWIKAGRTVEQADIVVWYTAGLSQTPRPEDWPAISPQRVAFQLVPFGFFNENPQIDRTDGRRQSE